MTEEVQYLTSSKHEELLLELDNLKKHKKPELASRIDEARQQGDLSENAEYHAAREEMSWVMSRIKKIEKILDNFKIINKNSSGDFVELGSTITVEFKDKQKQYTIVGAQEADPLQGRISNESPLGSAFLGRKKGDIVSIQVPAGVIDYKILDVE